MYIVHSRLYFSGVPVLPASQLGPYFLYETTRSLSHELLWQAELASNLDANPQSGCSGSRRTGKFPGCARLSAAMNSRCFITMNEGAIYLTSLDFDDKDFCRQFVDLLKQHYGELLTTIGDLEVV